MTVSDQNAVLVEYVDPDAVSLPLRVRARSEVWWPAFVVAVVLWVLFVMILLGLPPVLFEDPSPMLVLFRGWRWWGSFR